MTNIDPREEIYRRRAQLGHVISMQRLGTLLEKRGAIDSVAGAEYWYRQAASKGSELGRLKLDVLLKNKALGLLNLRDATTVEYQEAQVNEYKLRAQAELGDSTDSFRYAMHLKTKGLLGNGVHGAEYWFRRARDQGHLGAAEELELVKSANREARSANRFGPEVTGVHIDYFKDPDNRDGNATKSDLWIEGNAQLATEEWLTEIVDRAEFLRKYLRKSLDKKFALELSDGVILSVAYFGNIVTGHLESSRKLYEVKFELNSFESTKPIQSFQERLTFGLALSWFIDLSIVFKSIKTSNGIYREIPLSARSPSSNTTDVLIRYVPTPRFYLAQEAIGKGEGVKKCIHSVAGHLRTLGYGMKPSGEARDRAPKYLRSQMKKNETFVRPHSRGEDEDRRAYEIRLSKFSACAHALVELKI